MEEGRGEERCRSLLATSVMVAVEGEWRDAESGTGC